MGQLFPYADLFIYTVYSCLLCLLCSHRQCMCVYRVGTEAQIQKRRNTVDKEPSIWQNLERKRLEFFRVSESLDVYVRQERTLAHSSTSCMHQARRSFYLSDWWAEFEYAPNLFIRSVGNQRIFCGKGRTNRTSESSHIISIWAASPSSTDEMVQGPSLTEFQSFQRYACMDSFLVICTFVI